MGQNVIDRITGLQLWWHSRYTTKHMGVMFVGWGLLPCPALGSDRGPEAFGQPIPLAGLYLSAVVGGRESRSSGYNAARQAL